MDIEKDIISVICNVLDLGENEVKMDASLYDSLGVDSTEMVELSVSLGKKFGIKLEQKEITNKNTIGEIVNIISRKKLNPC